MNSEKKLSKLDFLKSRARELKKNIGVLYLAFKHKNTPWYAKVLIGAILSYALSPVDLVPDFVPILGYLDDLVLIPAGIAFAIKLIPKDVLAECRAQAEQLPKLKKKGTFAALLIILFWVLVVYWLIKLFI
ncbi:YkvA family protein [Zhaonella formicivorans]|uniref:YkvA family protein n=1 Tax=Zhaonella formicivorans TaxID=2528593 RepID=UPI0010E275FE|nr:YkvA family protein [Zhaonella formicivorans]